MIKCCCRMTALRHDFAIEFDGESLAFKLQARDQVLHATARGNFLRFAVDLQNWHRLYTRFNGLH